MQEPSATDIMERAFTGDLRYLLAVSHIVLANNQVTNRFIEQTHDLPVQAWSTLYAVVHFPGILAKEVQVLFPRPQNSISRAVSLLCKRGLIRREAMKQDTRAKQLYPTEAGMHLLHEIEDKIRSRQDEVFGVLSPSEKEEFLRLCLKMVSGDSLGTSAVLRA